MAKAAGNGYPLHLQLLHQGSTLLIVIIRKSGTLKIKDKQPLALTVYSIYLELEGFETPEESRFLEQY